MKKNKLGTRWRNLGGEKLEGIAIRSRVRWFQDGEKNSKYFCNLENRNFTNKSLSFLERDDGTVLTNQKTILTEVQNFYQQLYRHRDVADVDLHNVLGDAPVLSDDETESLGGKIYHEAGSILKTMNNNKSPGPDGFTTEFFKFFFVDLGIFFVRSANEGFERGELSVTRYQGIITCIPKEGKPKQYIKN